MDYSNINMNYIAPATSLTMCNPMTMYPMLQPQMMQPQMMQPQGSPMFVPMTVPQGLQPIVVLPPTLPMIPLNSDIMMPGTALTKTMSAPLAGDCSFPEIDTSLSHAGSMPLYSTNMMYYPVEMENRLSPVSSSSDLSSASSFSDSSFSRGSSPCAGADSQRSTPRNWVDLLCAKNEKPKTSVKRRKKKEVTKKELAEEALEGLQKLLGDRFTTTGMRGETVLRCKAKTTRSLRHVVGLIEFIQDSGVQFAEVSCPISTKKNSTSIQGFLLYMRTHTLEEAKQVEKLFNEYNLLHKEERTPFKTIELNPMSKSEQAKLSAGICDY